MSAWKFKTVEKAHHMVILHFSDSSRLEWGDTMSVTIPPADAQKLLSQLETALHPRKDGT